MKTFIINPPTDIGFERSGRWPSKSTGGAFQEPLFLAYAAAVLEKNKLDVELIDCRPNYIDINTLKKMITDNVGLIVLQTSTPSIESDIKTAEDLKQEFPEAKIALVGPHPTIFDQEILQSNAAIDYIARGEYDYTLKDLAFSIESNQDAMNIEGITLRKGTEIIRTKDRPLIQNLDELPFPARHFLPIEEYYEPLFIGKPTIRLISSRGCPFNCTFCLWPQTMYGRKVRTRSPKNVVDEIQYLFNEYKIKEYYFDDDTFTVSKKHVESICEEIKKRQIDIPFDCLGRVDMVSKEMLEKMADAGCITIRYGVESSSQDILNMANKKITIEQIKNAFEMTKKVGIQTHATVMFGLPGETKDTINKTIKFILELDPDYVQFAIATPYPGTEFYNLAKSKGWLIAKDWQEYDPIANSVVQYPDLDKTEIENAIHDAYKAFYFRTKYIIKRFRFAKSFSDYTQLLKGAYNLCKNIYIGN
ncbi:MAG: radical SAM protein [Candidatus Methanoperedens sp.]